MTTILELLRGRDVLIIQDDLLVAEAVRFMVERNIGAVPVLHHRDLVGIFSERDVMNRVVMRGVDPNTTPVSEVMSTDPLTVRPEETIHDCMVLMKKHGFRHLPVCEDGRLIGFLSLRDLLLHQVDEQDIEVRMMRAYISS